VTYKVGSRTTAEAGTDFNFTDGTLMFLPGDQRKAITVEFLDDSDVEPREILEILLEGVTGLTMGDFTSMTLLISDDDV